MPAGNSVLAPANGNGGSQSYRPLGFDRVEDVSDEEDEEEDEDE